jgi:predicted nucleotidyltransferase
VATELEIALVVGFGSSFTGRKRGISTRRDIDLVIVSDFFESMSISKRKEIVIGRLGNRIDPILLTTLEYRNLKRNRDSIVNVALKEGTILYDAKRQSHRRAKQ